MPAFLVEPGRTVDVLVPDGAGVDDALARTTVVAVGAHPDDVELLGLADIGACRDDPLRWFTGLTVADGAGAPGPQATDAADRDGLPARRRQEQRNAARIGRYGLQLQLGRPSAEILDPRSRLAVVGEVAELLRAARPTRVLTHSLLDRHPTHVAVALAVIDACRRLGHDERPAELLGVEVWRGHDWLPDAAKVRLDASGHGELGARLLAAHASQVAVKPYDVAAAARRRANATFDDPHRADAAGEVVLAADLTPLLDEEGPDPVTYVDDLVDRLRDEVVGLVRSLRGGD
nr:PIG-L family deacetylase [Rhabdothermincola salaria]